jgi:hypothetical protein
MSMLLLAGTLKLPCLSVSFSRPVRSFGSSPVTLGAPTAGGRKKFPFRLAAFVRAF